MVFIHVGRFSRQKNHKLLIKIFEEIVKQHPDSILLLLGDGELKKEVKNNINSNSSIKKKVIFLGLQKNVNEYLSASDIFLLPSIYEGFPVVAIEAQCNGIQTWVSKNITNEILINSNINCFSIKTKPQIIADTIMANYKPISNIERREKADELLDTNYCINKTVKKLSEVYRKLSK